MREPFFGSNAKAFFTQMAAAVAIGVFLWAIDAKHYIGLAIDPVIEWLFRG